MCINSACKNIRNPSIRLAVDGARLGDALPGLGNRWATWQCPQGGAATPSPNPAPSRPQPSPRPVCPWVPPVTRGRQSLPPHQGTARGTVPDPGTGVPASCPMYTPQSRGSRRPSASPTPLEPRRGDPRHLPRPVPPLDTHRSRGLPWGTAPQDRCLPPAWRSSLRGSGEPGRTGSKRGGDFVFVDSEAGVQLGKGQSPSSSPDAGREAARALGAKLGRPGAPPAAPPPRLFGLGVPGRPPAPGGYLRTPPSPRPACSATPPRSPGHRASERDTGD